MVANEDWLRLFSEERVRHVAMSISDHCLLMLSLMRKQTKKQGRKHFFFEAMWTRDERCREIIKGAWEVDRVDSAGDIRGRIKRYQEQLKKWNWMEFENVNKMPKEKKRRNFNSWSYRTVYMGMQRRSRG